MDNNQYREVLPNIQNRKCKLLHYFVYTILAYSPLMVGGYIWYKYDLYFSIMSILVLFLTMGIISSKMKNEAIPPSQIEFSHSTFEIAKWYVSKILC